MHDAIVIMKDGTKFCGPLWAWRPKDGWFEIIDDSGGHRILLADVASAIQHGQRVTRFRIEDVDLLVQARADGWVPS